MPLTTINGKPAIRISDDERMKVLAREVGDLLGAEIVNAVSLTSPHVQQQTAKELVVNLQRSFVQLLTPEVVKAVQRRARGSNGPTLLRAGEGN